jgi:hypothetical protein
VDERTNTTDLALWHADRGPDAGDSAESASSLRVDERTGTTTELSLRHAGRGPDASDCAKSHESRYEDRRERSLLDELLDKADAERAATYSRSEGGDAWRGGTAETLKEQDDDGAPAMHTIVWGEVGGAAASAARPRSELRQWDDAAKRSFDRADALVALAQQYLRGDRPERTPIEVMLTIPMASLRAGSGDPVEVGEIGVSYVSREAARRLSCDAGVVEIVEDEHGVPLSVGRKRRTIAGALKRALRRRDRGCSYPGCTNRLFLEGHHIRHWADGGETSLKNTAQLCSAHHRYVHEYGYSIELGSDQRPQFRDPTGRLVAVAPERPCGDELGWPWIRRMNEPLAIDAGTNVCGWDGRPPDYSRIIDHLVAADSTDKHVKVAIAQ